MSVVVLASASRTRAGMLERAGVAVVCDPAAVDEEEVKRSCRAEGMTADAVAEALALLKAKRVSARHPGALVIGADQMLECDGEWFEKPADRTGAREQLLKLRDRTHRLISCAVVARDGERLKAWSDEARMTMRPFSHTFLESYLDAAGDDVLQSVGAYQLEGLGSQLFARVDGDHFTVLGLPLLPILDYLRGQGVLLV